jgi:MoaA/NifB/PqqE/SkfB family radical SAM enzyme
MTKQSGNGWFCTRPWKMVDIYNVDVTNNEQKGLFVYPCCARFVSNSLGNLVEDSFDKIWNGCSMQKLRESIIDGSYRYCDLKTCMSFSNKNKNEFNEFFDEENRDSLKKINDKPPEIVKLSYDKHCNIRCVTCRDTFVINSRDEEKRLDSMIDTVLLPLCAKAKYLMLDGSGEALSSPHCRKLIKNAAKMFPSLRFCLITNGILADKDNFEELGILDRLHSLSFSLNAAKKKTYIKFMRNSNYDKVIKNIEYAHNLLLGGGGGGGLKHLFLKLLFTSVNKK